LLVIIGKQLMDEENHMIVENPMIAERINVLIPVANEVRLQVRGESIVEPKRPSEDESSDGNINKTFCEKVKFWLEIFFIMMFGLAFFAAFISFFVWMADPTLFGPEVY